MDNYREVNPGNPTALKLRVDAVAARAARAEAERQSPLEVKLGGVWFEVVGGVATSTQVSLLLADDTWTHLAPSEVLWARWGLGDGQEWVQAPDLVRGDVVHNLGDVAWTVREVTDRPGAGPARGTTWVVLRGDSDEGYFARFHGGETEYLAAMDEPVAVSWPRPNTSTAELEG